MGLEDGKRKEEEEDCMTLECARSRFGRGSKHTSLLSLECNSESKNDKIGRKGI